MEMDNSKTDGLKIVGKGLGALVLKLLEFSGRVLPEDKAQLAEKNTDEFKPVHDSGIFTEYLFNKNGNLVRKTERCKYHAVPDASHSWKSPHYGYCPVRKDICTYDTERQLIEKEEITTENIGSFWESSTSITFKYRPGTLCWYEKTVRRSSWI